MNDYVESLYLLPSVLVIFHLDVVHLIMNRHWLLLVLRCVLFNDLSDKLNDSGKDGLDVSPCMKSVYY